MLHVAAASVSVTSPVTDFALEVGEGRAGRSERERGGCQHRVKLSARVAAVEENMRAQKLTR